MKPPYHAGFLGIVSNRFTLGDTVLGPLPAQGLPGRWPTGPEGILALLAVFEDGQKEKKVKDFRPTSTRRRPTWPLFPLLGHLRCDGCGRIGFSSRRTRLSSALAEA